MTVPVTIERQRGNVGGFRRAVGSATVVKTLGFLGKNG